MNSFKANETLDATGLACPMPVVRTKKKMEELDPGKVLEILATDKGSEADIKAWAERNGHSYLGTMKDETMLKHYIRKCDVKGSARKKYPHTIDNEQLEQAIKREQAILIDVREQKEYMHSHIPEAISIPLGDVEARMSELDANQTIYVICRTGNRSDLAAQLLNDHGFERVYNVVPGMSQWAGAVKNVQESESK